MKRGKDEEKTQGPMFPRLHVNDTEKGGPRAPPRNKMALYEQLSIPSQRFTGGIPKSTPKFVPSSSSIEGTTSERGTLFPLQQPPSFRPTEETSNRYSNSNNQYVQEEHKKKQEEDDFQVPIFVQQCGISQYQNRNGNHQNRGHNGSSSFTSAFAGRLSNIQNPRQNTGRAQKENSQDVAKSDSNQSSQQNTKDLSNEANISSSFGHINASRRLQSNGNLRGERVDSQVENRLWGDSALNESVRATGNGISQLAREAEREASRSPNDTANGDAVSETSMVDSICGVDISPDDVVEIIGQKHFWKARRAIVNQQRVFAVQVFELHRLIKVQRLIAGSPQLLVDDTSYLAKPPPKVSPIKKIPLEYIVKPTPSVPIHQDDPRKPNNDEMEFSAENAVGRASLSSVQNGSQTANSQPFPPLDPKMGGWSYNQPPGHQWLIPVMSPSEGLVYKPYPGPGFMSPSCGGCGPPPIHGHEFPNYGVPHHHHQHHGPAGAHPFVPASHGYFPPYPMPMMHPSISGSTGHQPNHQSSRNVLNATKVPARKETEVQASTASSPSEKSQGRTALPLFPISPPPEPAPAPSPAPAPAPAPAPEPTLAPAQLRRETEPARVIRVVPHNARLATASVARIFQSIQEERKQHDLS